ncbi:actin-like ATPase domain-containing protein [Ascobolus immersus RN42]|uniref:Actin-like ATPase domain-containing protein n=1 Tax=Ascobolus immersus RN42 TaxID=1160509 RepID=A0A3N4I8K6_ASCIM|nr:actin-like ATPase domain-containing protein [Ascobolus immersus RN42]
MASENPRTIIIDNGSWRIRAGFSDSSRRLCFPPLISRFKDRKSNETFLYCGEDVFVDSVTKSSARRPSDQNIIVNFEAMESLLDYTFLNLGLDTQATGVATPLVIAENFHSIQYPRKRMMELLFEAYSAPSLSFEIDSLLAFFQNNGSTGLVVSCGHSFSHIIPVYDGTPLLPSAARLNWSGARAISYTADLLGLKYPSASRRMTQYQAESIFISQSFVAPDYSRAVGLLSSASTFGLISREVQIVANFPSTLEATDSISGAERAAQKTDIRGATVIEAASRGPVATAMRQRDTIISKLLSLEKNSTEANIRRHAANKARMRDIALLACDNGSSTSQKATSRNRSNKAKEEQDDLFGIDDNDWTIYQDLKSQGVVETFSADARDLVKDLEAVQNRMSGSGIDAVSFRRIKYSRTLSVFWGNESTMNNALTLNVERLRSLEPFFNPSIAGLDSAGLPELAAHLLGTEFQSISGSLAADIFVTGGCCLAGGFRSRFLNDLARLLPENEVLRVRLASDPIWDPWQGAARRNEVSEHRDWISRSDWEEGGAEYCVARTRIMNSSRK